MEQSNSKRRAFALSALIGGATMLSQTGKAQSSGQSLSKKHLADLVATAKTAADHRKLEAHYLAAAARHEAEAQEHLELAAKYKANPTLSESKHPGAPDTASHCMTFAEHCKKAAKMMRDMAAMHEGMAKNSK